MQITDCNTYLSDENLKKYMKVLKNQHENSILSCREVLIFTLHIEDCKKEKSLIKESFYVPEQLRTK